MNSLNVVLSFLSTSHARHCVWHGTAGGRTLRASDASPSSAMLQRDARASTNSDGDPRVKQQPAAQSPPAWRKHYRGSDLRVQRRTIVALHPCRNMDGLAHGRGHSPITLKTWRSHSSHTVDSRNDHSRDDHILADS